MAFHDNEDEETAPAWARLLPLGKELARPKQSVHTRWPRRLFRVALIPALCIIALLLALLFFLHQITPPTEVSLTSVDFSEAARAKKIHMLLTANKGDVNMCKTILTSAALGYPAPTIIAWNQSFARPFLLGGGSHIAKITEVLKYFNSLGPEQDDEIAFVLDAYDIWFQLPPQVLMERYLRLNAEGNARLMKKMGGAAITQEHLEQTIVFAAGKRCAPNMLHTVACYPLPEPPISMDLYGGNTDTSIGRNYFYSRRQRYLNSGYMMGPIGDMRALFRRAAQLVEQHVDPDPEEDGSHIADLGYHGSDQSLFNLIFGQQEYRREVIRRQYQSWLSRAWNVVSGSKPDGSSTMQGMPIDDLLNPSFTHEHFEPKLDQLYEYHVGLDYTSDLGHQTMNSDLDGKWLSYDDENVTSQIQGRTRFDCPLHIPQHLPDDIFRAGYPFQALPETSEANTTANWYSTPLYTHLCYGTIPIMVHFNGDKSARDWAWRTEWVWFLSQARALMAAHLQPREASFQDHLSAPVQSWTGGVWADTGRFLEWDEICPAKYETKLFVE